jgi:hypothetical protein
MGKDLPTFSSAKALLEQTLASWRKKWGATVNGNEYEIISRFSVFVLVSTVIQRQLHAGKADPEGRKYCETLALEVICSALNHYKTWSATLNSDTFE